MTPDALLIDSHIFWERVGAAFLCGLIIGVERQLRGKASGVRTCILICLGTEIFVALGSSLPVGDADPLRVLGQVITGIGFLGAGAILSTNGRIVGLTSAAVIWMLAAMGSLIGLGFVRAALVLTGITLGTLIGVEALETWWHKLRQGSTERELSHIELTE